MLRLSIFGFNLRNQLRPTTAMAYKSSPLKPFQSLSSTPSPSYPWIPSLLSPPTSSPPLRPQRRTSASRPLSPSTWTVLEEVPAVVLLFEWQSPFLHDVEVITPLALNSIPPTHIIAFVPRPPGPLRYPFSGHPTSFHQLDLFLSSFSIVDSMVVVAFWSFGFRSCCV
ncbi:uncharacterized protein EI90DRAFT_2712537 [Cantharellus anzutake]|uniref:uncharacterized protein n=1 Tax=Cantharellus anzutake TaxID=1750568 RepID=UPI0019067307|nr:uncharacterized protein EI90DRAFT_2712537 [Cantharellus anzutake]KAF8318354.1 hypothetical protein EI90DRAFT_2712537 [Cantharellus anzutake]